MVKEKCRNFIYTYGYCDSPADPENPTAFFKYDSRVQHSDAALAAKYMCFKQRNEQSIKRAIELAAMAPEARPSQWFNKTYPCKSP